MPTSYFVKYRYFRKILRCQYSWFTVQWEPSCSMDGRTDRHDEGNNRFAQFCERAKKVRKVNSRNFSLALRLLLLGMLLATWGHYRKRVESYFVCQILIKGNSCDSETRVGVSTGENHKVRHRFLVRASVVWTDPLLCREHTPKHLPSGTSCGHEKKHKTRIVKDCTEIDHITPQKVWQATISAWCCSSHLLGLHWNSLDFYSTF